MTPSHSTSSVFCGTVSKPFPTAGGVVPVGFVLLGSHASQHEQPNEREKRKRKRKFGEISSQASSARHKVLDCDRIGRARPRGGHA
jgi:hypothetical protein